MLEYFHIQTEWTEEDKAHLDEASFREKITQMVDDAYKAQVRGMVEAQRHLERVILLQMVDNHWKDHLLSMDRLEERP